MVSASWVGVQGFTASRPSQTRVELQAWPSVLAGWVATLSVSDSNGCSFTYVILCRLLEYWYVAVECDLIRCVYYAVNL